MSYKTRKNLNKIADLLQRFAEGLISCIEIILGDHGGKRPRRSHRIITRRVYQRARPVVHHIHYYQRLPLPRREDV